MNMANKSTTGPSDESFLSSYFRNPFKSKRKPDVELKGGPKDPRLEKGTSENIDYEAKKKSGGWLSRKIFEASGGGKKK